MQGIKQLLVDAARDIRTIIALISLVLAFIAFRRHKRKRLAFEILSNTPLLSIKSEVKDRVKIYLDDRPVKDVNLMLVRITNTGNESILSKDFETPITINFDEAAILLSFEIFERVPVSMPLPDTTLSNSWVSLSPFLLNEKDSITIKMLVSGVMDPPIISARIAGLKTIEHKTRSRDGMSFIVGLVSGAASVAVTLHILRGGPGVDAITLSAGIVPILVIMVTLMAYKFLARLKG